MKISKKLFRELSELGTAYINDKGEEVNNPVPLSIAPDDAAPSLQERIQQMVRSELSREAAKQQFETFEESQDFDIEDEFDLDEPMSDYVLLEDEFPVMSEEIQDDKEPESAAGVVRGGFDEEEPHPPLPKNEGDDSSVQEVVETGTQ